jgi:4-alpha-glucanotransferase
MAVLQFAFDGSDDNPHRPENITRDTVAYTGTHDNNTCVGWFESLDDGAKEFVFNVLKRPPVDDIAGTMIDVVFESPAQLAIVPLQDILRLGSQARMNTPGVAENNWQWTFQWRQVDDHVGAQIRRVVERSERMNDDR